MNMHDSNFFSLSVMWLSLPKLIGQTANGTSIMPVPKSQNLVAMQDNSWADKPS